MITLSAPGTKTGRLGQALLGLASMAVLVLTLWAILGPRAPEGVVPGAVAASTGQAPSAARTGPSGLPVPRFVSLKNDSTNVRRGPSSDHAVLYVYKRKGMPVEIVAEAEHWRRIRDSAGEEGWVYKSLLSGTRTFLVAPWETGIKVDLKRRPDPSAASVARLESGVAGEVESCDGAWCAVLAGGYEGFAPQNMLFGVYPGEVFGD
jgi:SH3-like domain-containing protein